MKSLIEKIGSTENRVWGTIALFGGMGVILPLMIIMWKALDRTEKVRLMMLLVLQVALVLLYCIPFVGWIPAVVWTVFYVICVIKYYKGELDYQIPLCYQIADKIVKQ